jgi:two-component system CheB/CheR fusion protein
LEALKQLLSELPDQTHMAFVVVQHLDPRHESQLADLLSKSTRLPVFQVTHGMAVRPDQVYVIPPNSNMALVEGKFVVTPRGDAPGLHLPVDYLFRSIAAEQQERAIGVILSGTGSDGTLGLCEIKAVGGIAFAQDEKTAAHAGMPRSAMESGCIDFVLPPAEIAHRLAAIGGHPYLVPQRAAFDDQAQTEEIFKRILSIVHKETGVDFSQYRDSTIRRRINRRLALHAYNSFQEYADLLQKDSDEVDALYRDLLINVTSFFRDPVLFEVLKASVFPEILKSKSPTTPIRIWVPGCSTGQEAYSLAMALTEFLDDKPFRPPIQIFATDLSDVKSLERARGGCYPESIEGELSPERLHRFFQKIDHQYRIDKPLREMCVFARQNIIADPPFSHVDLITCRNVLIYMSGTLQKRIMPIFHFALNVPGYIALGTAETVGEFTDLFELVDRTHKVYAKKSIPTRPIVPFTLDARATARRGIEQGNASLYSAVDFQKEADRLALRKYAPPAVLINENFDILQFRGRTAAFLESPSGEPTANLLKLAREGLMLELRAALNEAQSNQKPVFRRGVRVRSEHGVREIDVYVMPVKLPTCAGACFLVAFEEPGSPPEGGSSAATSGAAGAPRSPGRSWFSRLRALGRSFHSDASTRAAEVDGERSETQALRQELDAAKDYMQSLVEQQDAINEELRSANEEVLSSNEELQSTNEELETAKEELQSANEELTTVNEQLQNRNQELSAANNDLTNIFSSTGIAVLMVGNDLCIRKITPPAQTVLKLLPSDVGRPIGDLRINVDVADFEARIAEVVATLRGQEIECRDPKGRWYFMRIQPYRTTDHRIEGVVVFLVDIEALKKGEQELREAGRRKDEFLAMLAHELRNPLASIKSAVDVLQFVGDDRESQLQAREILERQVDQMARLVGDLLDMSRIAEGKIEVKKEPLLLKKVVEMSLETVSGQIENSQHELKVTLPDEPLFLLGDRDRLSQVLTNLLGNAAKFTDPGGIIDLIVEKVRDRSPSPEKVEIRVRDNGVGMSPELLPHIFEMFAQGESNLDRTRGGLGVGLTLVKTIVELHGGTVAAHSAGPGRGSEFIVRLPLLAKDGLSSKPSSSKSDGKAAPVHRKVVVVDDKKDARESLAMLLKAMGHEVHLGDDGRQALAMIRELKPDLALIDIGLPGLNGYEVARKVREQSELDHVLLVAYSGYGQDGDRARAREAGFDQHLVKPADMASLQALMSSTR